MIKGIGIDAVEIDRIADIIVNKPTFAKRILTLKELERFNELKGKRKTEFLAGRFACKEAYSKAMGTGIGTVGFHDIEVLTGSKGEPVVTYATFQGNIHVSLTHTDEIAIAYLILEL